MARRCMDNGIIHQEAKKKIPTVLKRGTETKSFEYPIKEIRGVGTHRIA